MYNDELEADGVPRQECPKCHSSRYVNAQQQQQRPQSCVTIASISDIIKNKLGNPLARQQMRYRVDRTKSNNTMVDIFDGVVYQQFLSDTDKHDCFRRDDDVAIGLYIDGFNVFNHSPFQATLVNMIIYNLPPEER
jgi:hypothetical protein